MKWRLVLLALASVFVLGMGDPMFIKAPPKYYVKVIARGGIVLAAPLDCGAIEFTNTCFIPGSNQQNIGSISIQLRDTAHDPTARYLQPLYEQLNYEQFIEVYPRADLLGDPVFSGVITELPDDLERSEIRGQGVLRELEKRRLRRYHTITGNAGSAVEGLLKTYNVVFSETFSTDFSGWNNAVDFSIYTDTLGKKYASGISGAYLVLQNYTAAQWSNSKISFDALIPKGRGLDIDFPYDGASPWLRVDLYSAADGSSNQGEVRVTTIQAGIADIDQRWVLSDATQWSHWEITTIWETNRRRIIVTLNGLEMLNSIDTRTTTNIPGYPVLLATVDAVGLPIYIDNFIFSVATNALAPGTIEATSETIDQTFNADTQLDAIRWIANKVGSWLYRVNPKAGIGASTFDFGSNIGRDLSSVIVLEAGKNIVSMQRNRTSDGLATSLYLSGQSQDDGSAAFVANDLDAFDTYGIVEAQESDERAVDTATAKAIADWRLANLSVGNISLSGTIADESALFSQTPVWGFSTWGDGIWGGRQELREGDQVWLKWADKNIDRKVRIVALTRTSGSDAVNLTFDYFPFRRKNELARLREKLANLTMAYLNRRNPRNFHFSFAANETQTRYFYPVGNIVNTRIDIRLASGSPTFKVYLDGSDRTLALFGAATLTATAHAIDTTYLNLAGEHSIGIAVTANQPGVFDVDVQPGVLS